MNKITRLKASSTATLGMTVHPVDKTLISIAIGSLVFGLMLLYQAPNECCTKQLEAESADRSAAAQEVTSSKVLMQVFSFSKLEY